MIVVFNLLNITIELFKFIRTYHSANIFEYPNDTSDTGEMKYIGI